MGYLLWSLVIEVFAFFLKKISGRDKERDNIAEILDLKKLAKLD